MPKFDVKIFGERNTGTNALKIILEKNSSSRVFPSTSRDLESKIKRQLRRYRLKMNRRKGLDPFTLAAMSEDEIDKIFDGQPCTHSWKHTATNFERIDDFQGSLVIFCVRNPLSWTYSLFKNPHNAKMEIPDRFAKFLDTDWLLVRRDNLPFEKLKPYQLYEEKVKSYSALIEQLRNKKIASKVVYFEDIVTQQDKVFVGLAGYLRAPSEEFSALTKSTKDKSKSAAYYKTYYGDEMWRSEIGPDVDDLSARLNKDLFASFGYKL